MVKVEETGRPNYNNFDSLDTAVLEAILQADFDAPEAEQMEMEQALYISNLIAERKGTKPKDVATAKAEFLSITILWLVKRIHYMNLTMMY